MSKPILTEQQKADNKLRKQLSLAHNIVTSAFNFHEIDTWEGVFKKMGYGADYINQHSELSAKKGKLTFAELKVFLNSQVEQLEKEIKNEVIQEEKKPDIPVKFPVSDGEILSVSPAANTDAGTRRKDTPDSWYGLCKSPNEKANLYWHQKKASAEVLQKIKEKKRGILILSGTGTGKTWMAGAVVRRLEDIQFHEGKTWSHIPYLYVTRATVVEQTERVLKRDFNLTVEQMETINIEQLRSRAGQYWVKEEMYIEGGEEKTRWVWKKNINPCVVLWDECQALKNMGSTQHQIASAYSELATSETYQVFISATPFTKVSEAKCFAVATRKSLDYICGKRSGLPLGSILTADTWPAYAAMVAYPSKPDEYNEAAVERLMSDLEDYVVRVKGVRPQFDAINTVERIDFDSPESFQRYLTAYEKYLKAKAKADAAKAAGDSKGAGISILVEFLMFRMAAELERADYLAREMHSSVQHGKAAVCACSFKNTIIRVVQILTSKYGVPRSSISLIWGGGQTQQTKKQKAKAKIMALSDEKCELMGTSKEELLANLELDEVEDRQMMELDPSLRLGMQDQLDRQREIDKFQSGQSLYCLYTLRAGGVGLSLHHCDELTTYKCRRKDSGYAVEEDIPNVPVRQRDVLVAPTWSPIEFVQGIGRVPRLTSLSPTRQRLVFYRGTIEGRVADIASRGLRCLGKIVRSRESWQDMIVNGNEQELKQYMDKLPEDSDGDSNLIGGSPEGSDE